MTDLLTIAKTARLSFERRERDNGSVYWKTKDDRPAWIRDMTYEAHDERLPDDRYYGLIVDALDFLIDCEVSDEEAAYDHSCEFEDSQLEFYTNALTAWLTEDIRNVSLCNEAIEAFGGEADNDLSAMIQWGMMLQARGVYNAVVNALIAHIDEEEEHV